jgi:enterochelin esterase-like enzyme
MPTKVWDDRGVFGDSFGALNTLFSGIALAGLFINIKIQNHQIRKLEEKDDRFEALQEKQILILKNTALLNYHTNQIMQIERNADQLAEVKGEDYILALIQNHVAQQEQAIAILKESIK